ncbi:hypothetical protein [Oceanobacillus sojae]|nr:hypothetical protein [Oceanobacillus sojae]
MVKYDLIDPAQTELKEVFIEIQLNPLEVEEKRQGDLAGIFIMR